MGSNIDFSAHRGGSRLGRSFAQIAIILLFIILGLTTSSKAAVNFSAADAGEGKLAISYAADAGELPRGIALTISLSNGATVNSFSDVVAVHAAYNTYMDYAFTIIDNGGAYTVGDGHPLADAATAGEPTLPASDFSICMGVLDQAGNQAPGPSIASPLTILQLHGVGDTVATVGLDIPRGGVVDIEMLPTNLDAGPITVSIAAPSTGCLTCLGDLSGDTRIRVNDLGIMINLFQSCGTDITPSSPCWTPCADLTCDGHIRLDDLGILINWLNQYGTNIPCSSSPKPSCP